MGVRGNKLLEGGENGKLFSLLSYSHISLHFLKINVFAHFRRIGFGRFGGVGRIPSGIWLLSGLPVGLPVHILKLLAHLTAGAEQSNDKSGDEPVQQVNQ